MIHHRYIYLINFVGSAEYYLVDQRKLSANGRKRAAIDILNEMRGTS